jgi:chemotaxis protein CheY-P-specific phosphatase CheC
VDRLAEPGNPNLVAVRQDFSGPFSGRALLSFPEAKSLELMRAVLGRQIPLADILDLEDEALAETGNIILNSWVATIANLLKQSLKMSLPIVIRRHQHHLFESATSLEESLIRGPRSGLSVAFRWRGRSLFQFLSHRQKLGGAIPQSTVRRLV